ncbi:2-aminoethylphosphonate--pyruvate transaminase [Scopulibacillus darangshiensis]|uniref:2-aminoethylphosphonate--pyruvate transaminase n=1 Tax=Scopulibacillus darangshiensis TaxID=442528 RepID=A0A4R2P9E5_9BACL|nr:2-aminoethylphosphonate--pyruvate transaminase [Scopulibacillus darangshiensis]TCP31542.1 2-aminoethylphosphonate--pyruvate transaminase [Scopulibacillus darangshiensis]
MDFKHRAENPYLLLTPGPLTTTPSVKEVMMKDWCTWDDDYNNLVQKIRKKLVRLATTKEELYTTILMQGSGTFSVESVIGTAIPRNGKLLALTNGAYGKRIVKIANKLHIDTMELDSGERAFPDLHQLEEQLMAHPDITHVTVVHCETTTGMLNPIKEIGDIVKRYNKTYVVDAMSSFGGIEMDIADLDIDYLISSANKCIQGVPGFGFIIAKIDVFKQCKGQGRSLSLDLYDQWETMESDNGKWRFTSPTHTVRAFYQAYLELEEEGGVKKRWERYHTNQRKLVEGMRKLGFETLLEDKCQSPIITAFYYPNNDQFRFQTFYDKLKAKGFVIYPGKVTDVATFRIGNIGDVKPNDIENLLKAIEESMYWISPQPQ